MEFLATIARSYKKFLYGLYETIYGSWIWFPKKVNPSLFLGRHALGKPGTVGL